MLYCLSWISYYTSRIFAPEPIIPIDEEMMINTTQLISEIDQFIEMNQLDLNSSLRDRNRSNPQAMLEDLVSASSGYTIEAKSEEEVSLDSLQTILDAKIENQKRWKNEKKGLEKKFMDIKAILMRSPGVARADYATTQRDITTKEKELKTVKSEIEKKNFEIRRLKLRCFAIWIVAVLEQAAQQFNAPEDQHDAQDRLNDKTIINLLILYKALCLYRDDIGNFSLLPLKECPTLLKLVLNIISQHCINNPLDEAWVLSVTQAAQLLEKSQSCYDGLKAIMLVYAEDHIVAEEKVSLSQITTPLECLSRHTTILKQFSSRDESKLNFINIIDISLVNIEKYLAEIDDNDYSVIHDLIKLFTEIGVEKDIIRKSFTETLGKVLLEKVTNFKQHESVMPLKLGEDNECQWLVEGLNGLINEVLVNGFDSLYRFTFPSNKAASKTLNKRLNETSQFINRCETMLGTRLVINVTEEIKTAFNHCFASDIFQFIEMDDFPGAIAAIENNLLHFNQRWSGPETVSALMNQVLGEINAKFSKIDSNEIMAEELCTIIEFFNQCKQLEKTYHMRFDSLKDSFKYVDDISDNVFGQINYVYAPMLLFFLAYKSYYTECGAEDQAPSVWHDVCLLGTIGHHTVTTLLAGGGTFFGYFGINKFRHLRTVSQLLSSQEPEEKKSHSESRFNYKK